MTHPTTAQKTAPGTGPQGGTGTPFIPWTARAAFPMVAACFFLSQGLLAFCLFKGWMWVAVPLVLVVSHFMHGWLIAFHEAAHGLLRKNRLLNEIDGILIGNMSFTSFSLYRALHQKHHVNLATEKDVELWPFVDTRMPRGARRLAAFLELNFGLFYTPFLFWRVFFRSPSPVSNPKVRARIWAEMAFMVVSWAGILAVTAWFGLWVYLLFNYFLPAFLAGNLQSWRKYIEHVGLSGHSARSATRSIVADSIGGKFVSLTLLHEPLHGIHHIKSSLPHTQLPAYTGWLEAEDDGDLRPFPSYRAAFAHLLRCLPDPRVGRQWETVVANP
jgi:fatty acid desaturase